MSYIPLTRNYSTPCEIDEQIPFTECNEKPGKLVRKDKNGVEISEDDNGIYYLKNYLRSEGLVAPITVHFDVTYSCNLKCKHCYVYYHESAANNEDKLLLLAEFLINAGLLNFEILGGEPFLCSKLFQILTKIHNKNRKIKLFTNGTLFNEINVKKLRNYKNLKLFVSIDGMKEIHDAIRGKGVFDQVKTGLDLLKEYDVPFSFVTVLGKYNKKFIADICDFAEEYKVKEISFIYLRNRSFDRSFQSYCLSKIELSNLEKQIGEIKENYDIEINPHFGKFHSINSNFFGCIAGVFECAVDPLGNMMGCSVERDVKCGNLFTESFDTVWGRVKEHAKRRMEKDGCKVCKHYERCYGKCDLCELPKNETEDGEEVK